MGSVFCGGLGFGNVIMAGSVRKPQDTCMIGIFLVCMHAVVESAISDVHIWVCVCRGLCPYEQ